MVPIHETNSHDVKNYHSIYDIAENRKRRFVEHVAVGTIGNCFSSGQPGYMLRECPGKQAGGDGAGVWGGGRTGAWGVHGAGRDNPPWERGNQPAVETIVGCGAEILFGVMLRAAAVVFDSFGPDETFIYSATSVLFGVSFEGTGSAFYSTYHPQTLFRHNTVAEAAVAVRICAPSKPPYTVHFSTARDQ
jgi:hypothetical protein